MRVVSAGVEADIVAGRRYTACPEPAERVAMEANAPPPVERSIVKPVASVELQFHPKSISLADGEN